jgi:heme-degrading monooxygenase HmoA
MYARVVTSQYQPGKMEEGIQIYRESILPEARQRPGFKGAIGLVDPSTGKTMSIVLWETEANMKTGETSGSFQAQLAKIVSFLATAPLIETYEVVVQE